MRKFYVCTEVGVDGGWSQQVLVSPADVVAWMVDRPKGHVLRWELGDTDEEGTVIGP
jgi:hypothetical protein